MNKNAIYEYPLSTFDRGQLQHIKNTSRLNPDVANQQETFSVHANAATEFYLRKQRFEDRLWVKDY